MFALTQKCTTVKFFYPPRGTRKPPSLNVSFGETVDIGLTTPNVTRSSSLFPRPNRFPFSSPVSFSIFPSSLHPFLRLTPLSTRPFLLPSPLLFAFLLVPRSRPPSPKLPSTRWIFNFRRKARPRPRTIFGDIFRGHQAAHQPSSSTLWRHVARPADSSHQIPRRHPDCPPPPPPPPAVVPAEGTFVFASKHRRPIFNEIKFHHPRGERERTIHRLPTDRPSTLLPCNTLSWINFQERTELALSKLSMQLGIRPNFWQSPRVSIRIVSISFSFLSVFVNTFNA